MLYRAGAKRKDANQKSKNKQQHGRWCRAGRRRVLLLSSLAVSAAGLGLQPPSRATPPRGGNFLVDEANVVLKWPSIYSDSTCSSKLRDDALEPDYDPDEQSPLYKDEGKCCTTRRTPTTMYAFLQGVRGPVPPTCSSPSEAVPSMVARGW